MVSRTALICSHYKAGCTKTEPKILQIKRGQKQRNVPDFRRKQPKSGAFSVLERMRTGTNGWGYPSVRTKTNPIPMQHMQKENRQKPRVSAGFVAGAAETGAAERHWRSLTPRHALRRAQPCLVAKSYRTLTKKSGTAEAIPDFFGRGRRT